MDKVTGILLLIGVALYSAYAFTTEGFEFGTKFYIQVGAMALGSLYVLWEPLTELLKSMTNEKKNTKESEEHDHDYCQKDFESLMYLKGRAKGIESKEAMDLIVKLNNILFCGKNEK